LLRLYEPTEGNIFINGVDIKNYDIDLLRKAISVIFQNFIKYPFNAKTNIGVGDSDKINDLNKIKKSAKMARINHVIDKLPYQYETILSKLYANGADLSMGEWQRIALARLFMKDSPIVILDEPTASVDIETEYRIFSQFTALLKNKLCVLISHRSFRKGISDEIIVLNKGEIVEQGSYDQLIDLNSKFKELHDMYSTSYV
jgi:ATP-binding cassette subfamily B protein/ATP-binding cassette subfamily C protein